MITFLPQQIRLYNFAYPGTSTFISGTSTFVSGDRYFRIETNIFWKCWSGWDNTGPDTKVLVPGYKSTGQGYKSTGPCILGGSKMKKNLVWISSEDNPIPFGYKNYNIFFFRSLALPEVLPLAPSLSTKYTKDFQNL